MKRYLEYKDEKLAKFWSIKVETTSHTVTYGQIGTEGQSKIKTFETAIEAMEDANKKVKEKQKKGYIYAAKLKNVVPVNSRFIEEEEAREHFNLKQYSPLGTIRYDAVVLIEGDVVLESGLYDDSIEEHFFDKKRETERELIIIEGNLTIKGDLSISGETGYPSLLILGDVHCDELGSYDNTIHISGDAYIKYMFYGNYNHGAIKIAGITHVPYLINSDHHSDLNPSDSTVVINIYNDYDDSFVYDYYSSELGRVFLDHLVEIEDEDEDEEDYEYRLELGAFSDWIEAGNFPFKEGAKPSRELLLDGIEEMAKEKNVKELDLTDKKLFVLIPALFEITSLERLILKKNDISILPDVVSKLTNLKELSLKETKVEVIPESIGQLKKLEILDLSYCYELTTLPLSFGNLENLEVLNISHSYRLRILPESIGNLKKLKKLILLGFKGEVPDTIFDLPQIEELEIII